MDDDTFIKKLEEFTFTKFDTVKFDNEECLNLYKDQTPLFFKDNKKSYSRCYLGIKYLDKKEIYKALKKHKPTNFDEIVSIYNKVSKLDDIFESNHTVKKSMRLLMYKLYYPVEFYTAFLASFEETFSVSEISNNAETYVGFNEEIKYLMAVYKEAKERRINLEDYYKKKDVFGESIILSLEIIRDRIKEENYFDYKRIQNLIDGTEFILNSKRVSGEFYNSFLEEVDKLVEDVLHLALTIEYPSEEEIDGINSLKHYYYHKLVYRER